MKKLNINKIIFMLLCSIGIGLGCFATSISLLIKNSFLPYLLLSLTYFLGIMLVKIRRKYPLFKTGRK